MREKYEENKCQGKGGKEMWIGWRKGIWSVVIVSLLSVSHFGCGVGYEEEGDGIIVLVTGLTFPHGITGDNQDIFWIEQTRIGKVHKNGGSSIILAEGLNIGTSGNIVIDESSIYWIEGKIIRKIPKVGGSITTIAELRIDDEPLDLAIDASSIYPRVDGPNSGIRKVSKYGGTPIILADIGSRTYTFPNPGIEVDKSSVYWQDGGTGEILKVSLDGGNITAFSDVGEANYFWEPFAIDSTYLYWAEGTKIKRKPKEGGSVKLLAELGSTRGPRYLRVDNAYLYWIECSLKGEADGAIIKIPKDGGPTITVIAGLLEPGFLYVDESHVYWPERKRNTSGQDCIKRAPK